MNKISRCLFLAAAVLGLAWPGLVRGATANGCLDCHKSLDDDPGNPAMAFAQDVHQKFGLTCASCHGGDPSREDMDLAKDRSFKGVPKRKDIPQFCGECHSQASFMRAFNPNLRVDQLSLYWTSQHGLALKKGVEKAAVCTDCHGVHGILPANMPKSTTFPWNIAQTCGRCHADQAYMAGFGIPTNQVESYRKSVHAAAMTEKKDLGAPTCNDCHGNHGAIPPEVSSIAFVCRQCHSLTAELFVKSPHKQAFDALGYTECEACHGQHDILPVSDDMLGTGEKAVCVQCHEAGSKGYETSARLGEKLKAFLHKQSLASGLLDKARRQGVEVGEPAFKLKEAETTLILIRNLTHTLSLEEVGAKAEEGEKQLESVLEGGRAALREGGFRRVGLIVATAFLLLLAAALFLKVRQISRKRAQ